MQLLIQLGHLLTFCRNFSYGMQDGGVVSATKQIPYFGQTFLGEFFGQVHGDLTGPCNAGGAFFGIHVRHFDLVIVSHCFLNVIYRNQAVLYRQQVA